MTLREELKPREEPTMSRIDHKLHDDIERQMTEFVRRGGRVNIIPSGIGTDSAELKKEEENRRKGKRGAEAMKKDPTPIECHGVKNRSKIKNKSGNQNIREASSGIHYVTIGSIKYGGFPTRQEALEYRDITRIRLNLPPADY